jgi:hypothetical protein
VTARAATRWTVRTALALAGLVGASAVAGCDRHTTSEPMRTPLVTEGSPPTTTTTEAPVLTADERADRIRALLAGDPLLSPAARAITVEVIDPNTIVLRGQAATEAEGARILRLAVEVAGNGYVRDELGAVLIQPPASDPRDTSRVPAISSAPSPATAGSDQVSGSAAAGPPTTVVIIVPPAAPATVAPAAPATVAPADGVTPGVPATPTVTPTNPGRTGLTAPGEAPATSGRPGLVPGTTAPPPSGISPGSTTPGPSRPQPQPAPTTPAAPRNP